MVKSVKAQLGDTRKLIREVEQTLATALREEGIGASVVGRAKNIYGVYQKMRRKKLKLLKVTDLLGFRVIVNKVDDAYRALGVAPHVYKIGRAAGRERGGTSVWISGGAGSYKKKK